jgi:hypothetical protein
MDILHIFYSKILMEGLSKKSNNLKSQLQFFLKYVEHCNLNRFISFLNILCHVTL